MNSGAECPCKKSAAVLTSPIGHGPHKLSGHYSTQLMKIKKVSFGELTKTALIIRIGFGGPLYYNYNQEPPN